MFLVELIASSFLDQISKQVRQTAAVCAFLLFMHKNVLTLPVTDFTGSYTEDELNFSRQNKLINFTEKGV